MPLPITLTLAAACALLNLWLAIRCTRIRVTAGALHGDGGSRQLGQRMRAHANFNEYTPIVLILFALVELAAGASLWLWIAALLYTISRIAHGLGMEADKPNVARAGGTILTWAVMLGLAGAALAIAYGVTRTTPAPSALSAQV
ncbi:MAG: MAPEG family protein [Sphingobium sp.]